MSYSNLYAQYIYITPEANASGEIYGHCPFHDDRNMSFSFNNETGLWYCFACEEGGSATHFVAQMEDTTYAEAEQIVRQKLGQSSLPSNIQIKEWQENLDGAPSIKGYLKRRGVAYDELVKKYELGWDGQRITLPVRDTEGRLVNVRRLQVEGDGPKVINWPGFGKVKVWPVDQLESADKVVLCAGEIDTLSALGQGYTAVTGTGGETVWSKDLTPLFSGKDVYICYDGDQTGQQAAQDRAIDLVETARSVHIVNLPEGEDVNSLHQQGKTLEEWMDRAITVGTPGARKVTGQELLIEAQHEAEQPWLIDNLIRPGWLGVLGGHGKAGKTTLVFHMIRCLLSKTPFLGYEINSDKPRALYVSYELGIFDLTKMYSEIVGIEPDDWPDTVLDPPRPLTPDELKPFLSVEPGLVVIDSATPAFALRGDAENQSGEIAHYLRNLQQLARHTGWSIIVIHHLTKRSDGSIMDLAGSREWIAAPDLLMTWKKGDPSGTLTVDGRVPPRDPLAVKLEWDSLELVGDAYDQKVGGLAKKTSLLLHDNPGMTINAIAEATGEARSSLWDVLKTGDFYRTGAGKRGDPHLWYAATKLPEGPS